MNESFTVHDFNDSDVGRRDFVKLAQKGEQTGRGGVDILDRFDDSPKRVNQLPQNEEVVSIPCNEGNPIAVVAGRQDKKSSSG